MKSTSDEKMKSKLSNRCVLFILFCLLSFMKVVSKFYYQMENNVQIRKNRICIKITIEY